MTPKKENFWLAVSILLIMVFSSIPNWVGYSAETRDLAYKGSFFDPHDYAVHISMIRAGMQGEWSYQFRFTTESHTPAYTRLFYVALGQTNRLFRLPPSVLFEIARWLFGAIALFSIYKLMGTVFTEVYWKRTAFILAVFSSGLGWLQLLTGWIPGPITPVDFWLIDAYVFFSVSLFPHFSFTIALLCLAFAFFLDFLRTENWKFIIWICILSILVQFVNPIAFALVDVGFVTTTLITWIHKRKIKWHSIFALALIAGVQLPLLIYNFNLLTTDPVWKLFTEQNQTLSPPFVYYIWGFGFLWPLIAIGTVSAFRQLQPVLLAALSWIIVAFLLSYAPFNIQRRFLFLITLPMALLATHALIWVKQTGIKMWPAFTGYVSRVIIFIVFLISLSSILLGPGRCLFLLTLPQEFYYLRVLDPALEWLQGNASPDDFVLSSEISGQLIAQKTDLRVFIGHPMETLYYDDKRRLVSTFFQGQAAPGWLDSTGVKWILFGPYESINSTNANLLTGNMELVFNSGNVKIYQVHH